MKQLLLFVALSVSVISMYAQSEPRGLGVNDQAPDFTANDQNGNRVNLKEKLKRGPVVLVFYRGQWCPYCNRYLKKLEDSISLVISKGASLITVTPETAAGIAKTIEKTTASYPILYDDSLSIMKKYQVAFKVDENTIEKYKQYGIDFTQANGSANGANLPVPAVYIIGTNGKIIFRHFDKNYTKRVSVAEILENL